MTDEFSDPIQEEEKNIGGRGAAAATASMYVIDQALDKRNKSEAVSCMLKAIQ